MVSKALETKFKKDFQQTVLTELSNIKAIQNICDTEVIHNYCDKKLWDNKPLIRVIKKLSKT